MKNVIVGTAGHVDHGKTWLIRALTGTFTDRLVEEQKRGITIENGFADFKTDEYDVSIIDVPGHEKFIKNMLAGVEGINIVLLVIGLDEGVMPQTVEHLQILKMLGIRKGILVFTKRDAVDDQDWIDLVEEDARAMVEGTFLEGAPSIEVSSKDGYNIEELRNLIVDQIDDSILKNDSPDLFRIPVDRVFTMAGHGTVITGTLLEGSINVGDTIMVYPEGKETKVRNIQVHNKDVEKASAGQRTAINLTGLKKDQVKRGDVLARKNAIEGTMMLDVNLEIFKDANWEVLNGSRVHFYCGAAETVGKLVLLDRELVGAGESCYAQIRLEDSVSVRRNDRFIIRFYSPVVTIGGGKILDANPKKHKRNKAGVIRNLEIRDTGSDKDITELMILEGSQDAVTEEVLLKKLRLKKHELEECINSLVDESKVMELKNGNLIHKKYFDEVSMVAVGVLQEYHRERPLSAGMGKEEFRSRFSKKLRITDDRFIAELMRNMIDRDIIKVGENTVSDFNFEINLSPELQEMKDDIIKIYHSRAFEMPTVDELVEKYGNEELIRDMLTVLTETGGLIKLDYKYYIDADHYNRAFDVIKKTVAENGSITLAEFRDQVGTSRKFAMVILEYMDNKNITRLEGDSRVLQV